MNLLGPADKGDFPSSKGPKRFTDQAIVKVAFLTAASDVKFHDKWMTSDTWAELICLRFILINDHSFMGKDLLKILGLKCYSYLTNQMDVDRRNLAKDHIGIFQDCYKDKTNKKILCFYACQQGRPLN
jgi:hypothetical protein